MAASPLPRPNHPGRFIRVCDQAKTQGMARRSARSMAGARRPLPAGEAALGRAGADPQAADLAQRADPGEPVGEAVRLDQPPERGAGRGVDPLGHAAVAGRRGRGPLRDPRRRGQQHGVGDLLQVPSGDGLLAVPGEDDLALLGDLERPADRAWGLGQHGPAGRSAAAAQRAAPAVEQGEPDAVVRGPLATAGPGRRTAAGWRWPGRVPWPSRSSRAWPRAGGRWRPGARRPAAGPPCRSSRPGRWPGRPRSRTAAPRRAPVAARRGRRSWPARRPRRCRRPSG